MAQPRRTETDEPVPAAELDDIPEPVPPPAEPAPEPVEVEPRLGFEEFLALAPALASRSASVQKATQAALQRWMQTQRLDPQGYYTRQDWTKFYDQMLTHA